MVEGNKAMIDVTEYNTVTTSFVSSVLPFLHAELL